MALVNHTETERRVEDLHVQYNFFCQVLLVFTSGQFARFLVVDSWWIQFEVYALRLFSKVFFNKGRLWPLFLYFCSFQQIIYRKFVDFKLGSPNKKASTLTTWPPPWLGPSLFRCNLFCHYLRNVHMDKVTLSILVEQPPTSSVA